MNLCCDIGNTRVKIAVFDGDALVHRDVWSRDVVEQIEATISRYTISRMIVSSTRDNVSQYTRMGEVSGIEVVELSADLNLPFQSMYETPDTLGRDRIAAVAYAVRKYPEKDNLIVDMGTCVTYDVVDHTGMYHGGNIAPGLVMRLSAMHEFTSALPKVEAAYNKNRIGRSTVTALQNGALYGLVGELEAYIRYMGTQFEKINVILTGGDAEFFGDLIDTKIFVHPYLVLEGLNEILKFNE